MKNSLFQDREFVTGLKKLAFPIALQHLMLSAVSVADTLMLGGLDQNSMSAVSLAGKVAFILSVFFSAATSAFTALGAQYWGKGDRNSLSDLFCLELRFCGISALISFLLCECIPRELMLLFTDEEALVEIGVEYLRIAGFSYLLSGLSQCWLALLKISNHTAQSALISSATVVINVVLNAILIFGLLGNKPLGVQGAAIATVIARAAELVWAFLLSLKEGYLKPRLNHLLTPLGSLTKDFMRCCLPLVGAGLVWGVGFASYSSFMGHMGEDAAAANSVISPLIELVCCFGQGIAYGGGILIGNELGAGELEKGKLYGDRLTRLSLLFGLCTSLLMLAITLPLSAGVKLTDAARTDLRQMLGVVCLYLFGRVVNTVIINGVFAAGGDTMFDLYSLAVVMWCIAIPLAILGTYVFHWPVWMVYACTCVDEVGKIPWVLLHYRKYKWVRNLTRERSAENA